MKGYLVSLGKELDYTRFRLKDQLSEPETKILYQAATILFSVAQEGEPMELWTPRVY
jgi:hypothetical protein